jgi:Lon-like ATP-dependent protease
VHQKGSRQVYRKAAFKIVQDLGEEKVPEPEPVSVTAKDVETVENQEPDVKPASERFPGDEEPKAAEQKDEKPVTTEPRPPMKVPDSVHIRITAENLRDYVGA